MGYDIIATLGPASRSRTTLREMLHWGVSGFRLNTSHVSVEDVSLWRDTLHDLLGDPLSLPLVLDLQGSKWRLGQFPAFVLREAQTVELVQEAETGLANVLPVPHGDFFLAAEASTGEVVLNDAKGALRIEGISPGRIRARITRGGEISPNKGITFTDSAYRKESLNERDERVFGQTRHWPNVRYALSYVKDVEEMLNYRRLLGPPVHLIAKLERDTALRDPDGMARAANELWLCRGDLGAEMGLKAMAEAVHLFSRRVPALPVPVLLAGQVLEHMTEHPCATRSELCYLHDTLQMGFSGLVLSDETAIGRYPVESCRTAALFGD